MIIMGYKIRYGYTRIYSDKDTELPDYAFNHMFHSVGNEGYADIAYMYPASKEDAEKVMKSEILHHILAEGAYK